MDKNQQQYALDFQQLHQNDAMFILPNIWNGGSARIFEKQGFQALATTSAGIAYSMGYADGEHISFQELCEEIKKITRVIHVPLSVDIELGYGEDISTITDNVRKIIETGAVGINLEDGYPGEENRLEELEIQVSKIEALTELKKTMAIPFVINARTCAYWLQIGSKKTRMELVIKRCQAYAQAGADCVFVPGALSEEEIQQLTKSIDCPLNIIANPISKDLKTLSKLGVKRLSLGSGPVRTMYSHLLDMAGDISQNKSIESMLTHDFSYAKANTFFG